jgi:hypothetical protein
MEPQKSRKFIWLIVFILILVLGFLSFYFINKNFSKNPTAVYSQNTEESKKTLVPLDFPFPQNLKPTQEFQREIQGLLEYTKIWETPMKREENQKIFVDYLKGNGWDPRTMEMGVDTTYISGTKGDVSLNIFIGKNVETLKNEVQVHFSQK